MHYTRVGAKAHRAVDGYTILHPAEQSNNEYLLCLAEEKILRVELMVKTKSVDRIDPLLN